MKDFIELKRLAEAANQKSDGSPWAYEPHGDTGDFGVGVLEDDQGNCVTGRQESGVMLVLEPVAPEVSCEAYAAFIAAGNPHAILALITENEALRKVATELRRFASCEHLHHDKPDWHEADEPCKVLARIDASMSKELKA